MSEEVLAKALQAFVNPDPTTQKSATEFLHGHETQEGFMKLLLNVIANNSDNTIKLAGCIYLKNAVKRNWTSSECHFQKGDCDFLVDALVKLFATSNKLCKKQLEALIQHLNSFARPETWGFFKQLSDMVTDGLNDKNIQKITLGLEIIDSLCAESWRNKMKNDALFSQIKLSIRVFLPTWKRLVVDLLWPALDKATSPQTVQELMPLMRMCVSIGHSWTYELPDEVEEHFSFAMEPFFKLLGYQKEKASLLNDKSCEDLAGAWREIMCILRIMAMTYEDVNKLYSTAFLPRIWNLLPTLKNENFNRTVIDALKYLIAMVRSPIFWENLNKGGNLDVLIQEFLLADDEVCAQFQSNPGEYIHADLQASDMDTKRRQCIRLIHALCNHSQNGNMMKQKFGDMLSKLIAKYESDRKREWKMQLLACDFMIGLAVEGQTKALGVTKITPGIPVEQFLTSHIFPEMKRPIESPLVFARCIKIVNMFRCRLPAQHLMTIITGLAENHLTNSGGVISSYIAMLIANCANQRNRDGTIFMSDSLLFSNFPVLIKALLNSFSGQSDWDVDVKRMEAIMFLCNRCRSKIGSHVEIIAAGLQNLINRSATDQHNPDYTYYLYESFGIFVQAICSANSEHVKQIESAFGATLEGIIQKRQVDDVIPFAYQIMALMMSHYSQIPPHYSQLFDQICNQSGMDSSASIPFLSIYMAKSNMFSEPQRLQNLLQTIRKLLSSDRTIRWGLDVANAVLRNEAIAENHGVAVEVFKIIFQTLMSQGVKPFMKKDFCKVMVGFINKYQAAKLRLIAEQVQKGFYLQIIDVILKFSEDFPSFLERRRFIMALISFISDQTIVQEKLMVWKALVEKCVILLESHLKLNREEDRIDLLTSTGKSSRSTQGTLLRLSMQFFHEQVPSFNELKQILAKAIKQLNSTMPNVINKHLLTQFERKYGETVYEYMQTAGISIT